MSSNSFHFQPIETTAVAVEVQIDSQSPKRATISLKDHSLSTLGRLNEGLADALDLALAVWISDRFSPTRRLGSTIEVHLPIRLHERLGDARNELSEVLYFLTGDEWKFYFTKRKTPRRVSETQGNLGLDDLDQMQVEVALFSGGIDSLAGLAGRTLDRQGTTFLLVGSGANKHVLSLQRRLASSLRLSADNKIRHLPVPLTIHEAGDLTRNRWQRARAFTFMLIGAAVAQLGGQTSLYVYENGIGAINLPFCGSEVGTDHARSVHPVTLSLMSEFLTAIFDGPFLIRNPYLFHTKAEMCSVLSENGWNEVAALTESCDRRHRIKPHQCGICSSCLLRRQSLLGAGITDHTNYINADGLHRPEIPNSHLPHMLHQAKFIRRALDTNEPAQGLIRSFPMLSELIDRGHRNNGTTSKQMLNCLTALYGRYVDEWATIELSISQMKA